MSIIYFFGLVALAAAASVSHSTPVQCADDDKAPEGMSLLQLQTATDSNISVVASPGNDETEGALRVQYPFYHTSDEIHRETKRLSKNCGGLMTMQTHSDDKVNIDVVTMRSPESTPVNRVFLLFGEHSRELISPESGLHLLKMMCGEMPFEGSDGELSISKLLQDNEFQLVLNGNPHSRVEVEHGEYCLRTNPNGVDLNRNWDEKWNKHATGDTNAGPKPFSEAETRIFKKLVEQFKPTTFLTVHSGTRGMYMPWAFDMEHTASYNAPLMLNVLKDIDNKHCKCPFGAAGKEVGYPCPGTCLDWVYRNVKTPFVFAWEIYTSPDRDSELKRRWDEKAANGGLALLQSGNHLGHEHFAELFDRFGSDFVSRKKGDAYQSKVEAMRAQSACFAMFNPETEDKFKETVQNWGVAYLEMASKIGEIIKKDKTVLDKMNSDYEVY